jgi:hypothetical protein
MSLKSIILSALALSPLAAAQLCGPDSNCDSYTDDKGRQRIRFREGMGPGTEQYEALFGTGEDFEASAADEITTQITTSDTSINYGCGTDISLYLDRINEICATTGSCVGTDEVSEEFGTIRPNFGRDQVVVTMKADGEYPGGLRNAFIESIKKTSILDAITIQRVLFDPVPPPCPLPPCTVPDPIECNVHFHSDFIATNRIVNGTLLQGFMEATISDDLDSGSEW